MTIVNELRVYASQLRAREHEIQAVSELVTTFLMEQLTAGSIGASKAKYSFACSRKRSHDVLTSSGTEI